MTYLLRQSGWWMLSDSCPGRRHRAGTNESHEVFGGGFEVFEPGGQRLVQGRLHPGGVCCYGLAAEVAVLMADHDCVKVRQCFRLQGDRLALVVEGALDEPGSVSKVMPPTGSGGSYG
jgi:hypothetical protein